MYIYTVVYCVYYFFFCAPKQRSEARPAPNRLPQEETQTLTRTIWWYERESTIPMVTTATVDEWRSPTDIHQLSQSVSQSKRELALCYMMYVDCRLAVRRRERMLPNSIFDGVLCFSLFWPLRSNVVCTCQHCDRQLRALRIPNEPGQCVLDAFCCIWIMERWLELI